MTPCESSWLLLQRSLDFYYQFNKRDGYFFVRNFSFQWSFLRLHQHLLFARLPLSRFQRQSHRGTCTKPESHQGIAFYISEVAVLILTAFLHSATFWKMITQVKILKFLLRFLFKVLNQDSYKNLSRSCQKILVRSCMFLLETSKILLQILTKIL